MSIGPIRASRRRKIDRLVTGPWPPFALVIALVSLLAIPFPASARGHHDHRHPTTATTGPTTATISLSTTTTASTTTTTSSTTTTTTAPPNCTAPTTLGTQHLVFDDEFNCDTAIKPAWSVVNGSTFGGTALPSNVSLSSAGLNLTATASSGAEVDTWPGKFSYTYGTVVWAANIPCVGGKVVNWPALWTFGILNSPAGGEIDTVEGAAGSISNTVHDASGNNQVVHIQPSPYCGWHTFANTWTSNLVTFTYDGTVVDTVTEDITASPMFLAMDDFIPNGNNDAESVPSTMQVQYVRVYQ